MDTDNTTPAAGAKRLRVTKTEREEHVAAWKHSGLSAADYAQSHGLRAANLYAWSVKHGGRAGARPSFVPVHISPGGGTVHGTGPRVVLRLGGLECVIEGAGNAEAFGSLAGALKREVFDV